MADIRLKDLRYLVAVADTGHFGQAAVAAFCDVVVSHAK